MHDNFLYLVYIAFVLVFGLASYVVNVGWRKVLGTSQGFGFWAASLLTIPTFSVGFGLYSIASYGDCPSVEGFAISCATFEEELMYQGWLDFLTIPIFSLCVSIPVTMWFTSRRQKK